MSDCLATWEPSDGQAKVLSGAFMFADVSGFTALSESLEARGREGAELLNRVITDVLTDFVGAARRRGGDVLAFGGDAILVHFGGTDPLLGAVTSAAEMQRSLEAPRRIDGLPPVQLGVSIGIHHGAAHALRIPFGQQVEAIVVGPTITRTLRAEGHAEAGQVLLTHAAARRVPTDWMGANTPHGVLLDARPTDGTEGLDPPAAPTPTSNLEELIAPAVAAVAGTLDAEGRHRRVAVGFVRVARMDEMVAERGPHAAHEVLAHVGGCLAEAASRTGVSILTVDSYPDAVKMLLCAGAPNATDDNDGALIETLRATAAQLVGNDVHFGAHRGLAFAGDLGAPDRRGYTLLGDTVNLAARLMQRAGPGEVLASADLTERTDAARAPLPPFRVKGKAEDIRAFRIEEGGEERRHVVDLPMVNREAETARLDELAARVVGGELVALDLVGEAGYGKSRLTRELANRHPELEPFLGSASPYSASTPYGLVRRLLRVLLRIPRQLTSDEAGDWLVDVVTSVAPDLLDEVPFVALAIDATVPSTGADLPQDAAGLRQRVARAAARLLRRVRPEPMLVLVDDVQWLDDASRQVLHRLAIEGRGLPWMLVAASRPGSPELFAGLPHQERMELAPLDDTLAAELVRSAAHRPLFDSQVDDVVARARGNCLFLVEYARSGDEDIPDDVESLLARRLDALDVEERRVLGVTAVVGTTPSLEVISAVSRAVDDRVPDPQVWESLGEWLEPVRGGVMTWRDPVLRETVYAALPYARRRDLHRAVFAGIESSPSDGSRARAVALAIHADLGRMPEEAWELLHKTGVEAAAAGSSVEAVDLLTRAMHWARELGDVPRSTVVEALLVLARTADLAGRFQAGLDATLQGLELTNEPAEMVPLLVLQCRLQVQLGNLEAAREAAEAAHEVVDGAGGAARGALYLAKAILSFRADDLETAFSWIDRVIGLDPASVSPRDLANAHVIGDAIFATGIDRRWEVGRGLPIAELLGDDRNVAASHNNLGIVAHGDGDWTKAVWHWERSAEAHDRAGSLVDVATSQMNIAEIRGDQGAWDEALEVMRTSRRTWMAGDFRLGIGYVTSLIGRNLGRLGRTEEATAELLHAKELLDAAGAAEMVREADLRMAETLWLAGRDEEARDSLADLEGQPLAPPRAAFRDLLDAATNADEGAAEMALVRALEQAAASRSWLTLLVARVLAAAAHGQDVLEDREVGTIASRLGVWRIAMPQGPVTLGPALTGQSVDVIL